VTPLALSGPPFSTGPRPGLAVWLTFDGARAHLRAQIRPGGRAVTLSSLRGDAELPAATVGPRGRAAVTFVEWRNGRDLLRVATFAAGRWRVVTLDRSSQPIWTPRVAMLPNGTTVAAWLDERDPARALRAAVLDRNGRWRRPVTLETADGLASLALGAGDGEVVAAWLDSVVSEKRVRVATLAGRAWSRPSTLADTLGTLGDVRLRGAQASLIEWQTGFGTSRRREFVTHRAGTSWIDLDQVRIDTRQ